MELSVRGARMVGSSSICMHPLSRLALDDIIRNLLVVSVLIEVAH